MSDLAQCRTPSDLAEMCDHGIIFDTWWLRVRDPLYSLGQHPTFLFNELEVCMHSDVPVGE